MVTATRELTVYQFGEYPQDIQVVDGKEWWSIPDACRILGHKNSRMATKSIPNQHVKMLTGCAKDGRKRKLRYTDEYGLNQLISLARTEQALAYKEWAFGTVLPTIRKTGFYSVAPADSSLAPMLEQIVSTLANVVTQQGQILTRLATVELNQGWNQLTVHTTTTVKSEVKRQERTPHIILDAMVKAHARNFYDDHVPYVWNILVYQYRLDRGINLNIRRSNKNITIAQAAERAGCLDDLIKYAENLFMNDKR